jgi:hypothetical protein
VEISGQAIDDPDFNAINGIEGTGIDLVHVRVPLDEAEGDVEVTVKIWYQTVSSRWLAEMFEENSAYIDSWRMFYAAAEKQPTLVNEETFFSTVVNNPEIKSRYPVVFPNPTLGKITIVTYSPQPFVASVYQLNGEMIGTYQFNDSRSTIDLSGLKGIYLLKITTGDFTDTVRKVIVY